MSSNARAIESLARDSLDLDQSHASKRLLYKEIQKNIFNAESTLLAPFFTPLADVGWAQKTSNAAKKIETRILRTPYFIDISRDD